MMVGEAQVYCLGGLKRRAKLSFCGHSVSFWPKLGAKTFIARKNARLSLRKTAKHVGKLYSLKN
jgi:hypothetical protein